MRDADLGDLRDHVTEHRGGLGVDVLVLAPTLDGVVDLRLGGGEAEAGRRVVARIGRNLDQRRVRRGAVDRPQVGGGRRIGIVGPVDGASDDGSILTNEPKMRVHPSGQCCLVDLVVGHRDRRGRLGRGCGAGGTRGQDHPRINRRRRVAGVSGGEGAAGGHGTSRFKMIDAKFQRGEGTRLLSCP